MGESNNIDMLNGPLTKKIIIFAIPIILSGVLQLLFNAADTIVVGRYAGSDSLAAVGSTAAIVALLVNFFVGISIGVNALTARLVGKNDKRGINETVHTAMLTSVISGFILVFLGVLFTKPILIFMGSPENVIDKSALYLRIYFVGMPVTMVYNFGSAILRAFGDTKHPLIYLSIGGVVNIVLNLFFVIVLNMDVAGVGLATILSQCVSAALIVKQLLNSNDMYHLDLSKLKIHRNRLYQMLVIGLPAGLQSCVFSLSNIIIQSSVNSFGADVMAGNAAASNIDGILYIALNAFNHTALTFTSQNYGAGKFKRIKTVFINCQLLTITIGISLGIVMYIFSKPLLGIYSSNANVINYGVIRLNVMCATYFLCGIMDCLIGALRGIGYSLTPMCISIICVCGIRILFIFTYFQAHRQYSTIFISYPLSWIAAVVLDLALFIYAYRKILNKFKNLAEQ